ncbi:hypothetical protein [Marinospirillum alkaliphilum]|uniref:Uncharacterized protein n=1 Tax=Marinospirillum alkaliphilum DSM 21637 TaxID=1122209 RepID=A0A1K1UGJ0_9GAMM|nr:hypothetical protein [Marinospirillum alkaliphilum]SFX11930.1 hypothetical protein SAMN02745752_00609 [Marinospirillum alkaliphilum DSM 21637]
MKNRLLIELETLRKSINRDIINPMVPELALEDLRPLLTMVARARADYVKELLDLASRTGSDAPTLEAVHELQNRRIVFQELVDAVNALETVIQREYMDVKTGRNK